MKKTFLSVTLAATVLLGGCNFSGDIALVTTTGTTDLGIEKLEFINTDDMKKVANPETLDIDKPGVVLTTPDGSRAFVSSAEYPLPPDRWFGHRLDVKAVNLLDQKVNKITAFDGGKQMEGSAYNGSVFDMELSADGERLVVGHFSVTRSYVSVYDTHTNKCVNYFTTDLTGHPDVDKVIKSDFHRGAWDLALNPNDDVVYVLASDGVDCSLRAFDMNDRSTVAYRTVARLLGGREYIIPYCGAENYNDYKLAVDPTGELLMVLSDRLYPFRIDQEDGSLTELYPEVRDDETGEVVCEAGLAVSPDDNSMTLHGKTEILFTDDNDIFKKDIVWVNSAGIHIGELNLGGGSICLDRKKILEGQAYPYVCSQGDFFGTIAAWITEKLGGPDAAKIVNDLQFYGVSASTMSDDTCFMVLSPILTADLVSGVLKAVKIEPKAKLFEGKKSVLLVTKPLVRSGRPQLMGIHALDFNPDHIVVNPRGDRVVLADTFDHKAQTLKKKVSWATVETTATHDFGKNRRVRGLGFAAVQGN